MSRRTTAAVCLVLALLPAPGVALADSPRPGPAAPTPAAPAGWGVHDGGDVCRERGEPPCHTATTTTTTATTTSAVVSGTSAVATTTGQVTGASTVGTTPPDTTSTSGTPAALVAATSAVAPAAARTAPRPVASSSVNGLADTGVGARWLFPLGLAVLVAGAVLLVFARRRRA